MLISCAVTAQLICVFAFAYAQNQFHHSAALRYDKLAEVLIHGRLLVCIHKFELLSVNLFSCLCRIIEFGNENILDLSCLLTF